MNAVIPEGANLTVAQLAVAYDIVQLAFANKHDHSNSDVTVDDYVAEMTNAVIRVHKALSTQDKLPLTKK